MAAILNSATLNSAILGSAILHKNKLHSFIFIQVDDGSHLEFCHLGYRLPFWIRTPCYLLSDSLKNTLTPLWLWLKLIHFDSLDDASHLEICHLEYCHLGFSHLSVSSQTHSHLPRLVSSICTKKNFTHSFWLNLMMAAILNSAMLDSDTAILDSDTLLSSLRFIQKHCHSTLTLTHTNSIRLRLKLMPSHSTLTHLTWWWQPSSIPPSWIWTSWI